MMDSLVEQSTEPATRKDQPGTQSSKPINLDFSTRRAPSGLFRKISYEWDAIQSSAHLSIRQFKYSLLIPLHGVELLEFALRHVM